MPVDAYAHLPFASHLPVKPQPVPPSPPDPQMPLGSGAPSVTCVQ